MRGCLAFAVTFVVVHATSGTTFSQDGNPNHWLQWRGPTSNNHAAQAWNLPLKWNLDTGENVLWKTPIPGRGHSTPIVIGDSLFLTTHDGGADTQSVLRVDRSNGRLVDQFVVHRDVGEIEMHSNNSGASPSLACDGTNIYACFHYHDAIWATSMTLDGQRTWQAKVCDYRPRLFQFGYGASPIIEGDLLIVAGEFDGPSSGLHALELRTGKEVWRAPRRPNLNFASPIVATIAGQRSVLIAGGSTIAAYDPRSGSKQWEVDTATDAICGTIVWDDRRVLISGGNPSSGTWCIEAAGNRQELWSNRVKCYEQSLITIDDHVFAFADNGVAYCWRTRDGKEMWKKRLFGGGISASPLLVGDELLIASESGELFTIAANPDRFELLATNKVGDSIFASPVAVDDYLYLRTGVRDSGERQEYLVAINSSRD